MVFCQILQKANTRIYLKIYSEILQGPSCRGAPWQDSPAWARTPGAVWMEHRTPRSWCLGL